MTTTMLTVMMVVPCTACVPNKDDDADTDDDGGLRNDGIYECNNRS